MKATALPTVSAGANSTPTPLSGVPTSTINGGGNGTPTQDQPGSGTGGPGDKFSPFVIGGLIFAAMMSAVVAGAVLVRKRLLPMPALQQNLPPSGAQPWQRSRPASMHDHANIYGPDNGTSTFQNQAAPNAGFPPPLATGNGFPPANPGFSNLQTAALQLNQAAGTIASVFPANAKASANLPALARDSSPITTGNQQRAALAVPPLSPLPAEEQVKPSRRAATRLVKLEVQEHSSAALPIVTSGQAWPADRQTEAISEEILWRSDPPLA